MFPSFGSFAPDGSGSEHIVDEIIVTNASENK
jgi:hypothetical protein